MKRINENQENITKKPKLNFSGDTFHVYNQSLKYLEDIILENGGKIVQDFNEAEADSNILTICLPKEYLYLQKITNCIHPSILFKDEIMNGKRNHFYSCLQNRNQNYIFLGQKSVLNRLKSYQFKMINNEIVQKYDLIISIEDLSQNMDKETYNMIMNSLYIYDLNDIEKYINGTVFDVPKVCKLRLLQEYKGYSCFYDFEKRLDNLNLNFRYNLYPVEPKHFKLPFELIVEIFRYLPLSLHLNMRLLSTNFNYFDNQYWKNHFYWLERKGIHHTPFNINNLHWFEYYIENYLLLAKEKNEFNDKIIPTYDLKYIDKKIKGRSRVGGLPDLPPNYEFPSGYKFILQINFSDLKIFNETYNFYNGCLQKGILYFFFKNNPDSIDECESIFYFYDGNEELIELEEKEPCIMYDFKFYEKRITNRFENMIFYDNRAFDEIKVLSMKNIILESETSFTLTIDSSEFEVSKFLKLSTNLY